MSIGKTIRPLPGFLVIEEVEADTKTASGLELPDSAQEKPQFGKVLSLNSIPKEKLILSDTENLLESVRLLEIQAMLKEGITIVFKKYSGHPIKLEGKEYQVVGFDSVIAIIE